MSPRAAPEEELLGAIADVAAKLGHTPSQAEWDRNRPEGAISFKGIVYRFGSWTDATELAGLTPANDPPASNPRYGEDDYRAALARVAGELGRAPTFPEYDRERAPGEPSGASFKLRYAGWGNAVAVLLG